MGTLDGDFPFDQDDGRTLLDFVRKTHDDRDVIKAFALEAGVQTGSIKLDTPIDTLWIDLLETAGKQRRLRALVGRIIAHPNSADPQGHHLLERLLAEPEEPTSPADLAAAAVASVVEAVREVQDAVFDTALLWDDLPFIDRVELRDNLKLMVGKEQRRTLLVMGEQGTGKTYTRQFIQYLKDQGGPRRIKPIDLSLRAGARIDERELATLVSDTLLGKQSPTFDPTAQAETVVTRFRTWLSGAVEEIDEPTWLVLDGFTAKTATAGALQLVNELAQAAAMRDLGKVHVVVLGYSGNPATVGSALCEPLHAPTRDDLKVFFGRAAVALQGQPPEDSALESVVDSFDQAYGPIGTKPLSELGPNAREHARAIFGAGS